MHRNADNALCCEAWLRNARKRKDNGHNGNNATTPNRHPAHTPNKANKYNMAS